jgi:16S rRNA (adenine1518-N6/adenine1519-N6)-dimethyltransferase
VQAAFAHRRKTLPNSLELAEVASREQTVVALAALGRGPGTRAEELAPEEFAQLPSLLT